jgi:hypothetical protein
MDEKGRKENYKVFLRKREHKVRDETRLREKKNLSIQGLLALYVKLKNLTTKYRLKTIQSYMKVTIMRKTPNHIYNGT